MTDPNRAVWRKSSRSGAQDNACVEVAALDGSVGIRDSKNPAAGHLTLSPESFATLIARVKQNDSGR